MGLDLPLIDRVTETVLLCSLQRPHFFVDDYAEIMPRFFSHQNDRISFSNFMTHVLTPPSESKKNQRRSTEYN